MNYVIERQDGVTLMRRKGPGQGSKKMDAGRVHLYSRFSPRRDTESKSCEAQLDAMRDHCYENRLAIVSEHRDEMASGKDMKRDGIWMALAALQRDETLLCLKPDRLSRCITDMHIIRRNAESSGGKLQFVESDFDWDTPDGKLIGQMLMLIAEFEREQAAARTRAAMRWHQLNGRIMGAVPYGFREIEKDASGNRRMSPDPHELSIIRRMFDLEQRCLYGARKIAMTLNEDGTTNRAGRPWEHTRVWRTMDRVRRYGFPDDQTHRPEKPKALTSTDWFHNYPLEDTV